MATLQQLIKLNLLAYLMITGRDIHNSGSRESVHNFIGLKRMAILMLTLKIKYMSLIKCFLGIAQMRI